MRQLAEAQKVKELGQVHRAGKWQSLDSDFGFLTLKFVLRTIISTGSYIVYITVIESSTMEGKFIGHKE